ncbi:hypothetical protein CASFOL_031212 [Castilleja foliolosa]|uniref:KIB1-4 beta-propeller domain-containing protein n=1 Tax=Castilleja foliolosa TaxID=1961234 RepID=A0ABD3C523_9LAMI
MGSLVKRRWATGISLLRRLSDLRSTRNYGDIKLGARMTMSTSANSSPSPPWLMLPPVFSPGGDMVYKFYNISEDKEESFPRNSEEIFDDDAKFVGSSHGWLALLNHRNNNHLYLYNPITRRHIKLPPIETLPDDGIRFGTSVSKLILSSSPDDDDECVAMMTFGPVDGLAFCQPCRSTKWTPIGELFFNGDLRNNLSAGAILLRGRAYEDFVYCARLKRFSCITQFQINLYSRILVHPTHELEHWDLSDPHSPISTTFSDFVSLDFDLEGEEWMNQNMSLLDDCRQIPYLIFTEQHNQLFLVIRLVMDRTIGFCVLKVDYLEKEKVRMKLMKGGNLDGLAMFIGMNHSFAVSADEYPNLKPNSIYFTDANKRDANSIYGGHDNGIFDYVNKELSPLPCYSNPNPCVDDLKRIVPPPMWFTPSLG